MSDVSHQKGTSRAQRAGLKISVSVVENIIRVSAGKVKHVPVDTSVYLSGLIEYITGDILDAAILITRGGGRKTITKDDIDQAIVQDIELIQIFIRLLDVHI